jgi:plastocyanin
MRSPRCLLLAAVVACGGSDATPPRSTTPAALTIAPVSGTMESLGDSRQLTATVRDANGAVLPGAAVSWTTSDQAIVSVSPASGQTTSVTSRGNGTATVTATAAPASSQQTFAVGQRFASLALTPLQLTVAPGADAQLTAVALDARGATIAGAAATATFQTSGASIATVNPSGRVHGVANGAATITASLTRDGVTGTATSAVTVADGGQTFPAAATVQATANSIFIPGSVDIAAGGTVTWSFGAVAHTVTFDFVNGVPASIGATSGASVARTFPVVGTFPYECTIHPGMSGTVRVH